MEQIGELLTSSVRPSFVFGRAAYVTELGHLRMQMGELLTSYSSALLCIGRAADVMDELQLTYRPFKIAPAHIGIADHSSQPNKSSPTLESETT